MVQVPIPPESTAASFITDLNSLIHMLKLPHSMLDQGMRAAKALPLKFPVSLLDRVATSDPDDPILIQFLPNNNELDLCEGFSDDPLNENEMAPLGTLQKYNYRVLILTTRLCAAQCRYCFRRHENGARSLFPLPEGESLQLRLDNLLGPFRNNPDVKELILSGGDPLTIPLEKFKLLLHYIKTLPHVNRVRIHTRLPVLSPQVLNDDWCDFFREFASPNAQDRSIPLFVSFQVNHPREINNNVIAMFERLFGCGIVLLSQTVLLRNVNDSVSTLVELFEKLSRSRVIPYYLHQLDRVSGAAHFEVDEETGKSLMRQIRKHLPGYAVPRYVRELPGQPNKCPIES